MSATCRVTGHPADDTPSARITFDFGDYRGQSILHLSLWNGEYYASYESQGLTAPELRREGQTATIQITTNPADTRFLLDSVSPTTNLLLGYADCHHDVADAADDPPETTTTTAATPAPKIYTNDRHEMTAQCQVQNDADGNPNGATISFDLGSYEGQVLLHLSQWNGEYYATYESQDIPVPPFHRNGQSATVQITTNPAETRFLLNSVSPTTNLLLGYADCHTAGE